jgi:serine/threonine protein kinase
MIVYDARGQAVALGKSLARGGEAIVYRVRDEPEFLAKLYVPAPRPKQEKKLAWMVAHPPAFPAEVGNHRLVAWPSGTLHNRRGQFVGYLMPFVTGAVPLLHVYSPKLREKTLPGFTVKYRYRAAQHLAYALSALHARGYVVGDLNESNILVTPAALITLIDTDSFQVQSRMGSKPILHPCPVGKAEYLPPELQGASLGSIVRQPEHDYFALAVLIFKLLMDGRHPFQGQWLRGGEPPALEHKIAKGWFPHTPKPHGMVAPPPNTPPLDVLPPQVAELLHACFVDGHADPLARPTPDEWVPALQQAEASLRECTNGHLFSGHLRRCHQCGAGRAVLPKWAVPVVAGARRTTARAIHATPQAVEAGLQPARAVARRLVLPASWRRALRQRAFWQSFLGMRHRWFGSLTAALLGAVSVFVVLLRDLYPSGAALPPLSVLLLTFATTAAAARTLAHYASARHYTFSRDEAGHMLALVAAMPPLLLYGLPERGLTGASEGVLPLLAWIGAVVALVAVLGTRRFWGWPFLAVLTLTTLPPEPLWLVPSTLLLQGLLLAFYGAAWLLTLTVRLPNIRVPKPLPMRVPRPPRAMLKWGVLAAALTYFGATTLAANPAPLTTPRAASSSAWASLPGRGIMPSATTLRRARVVNVAPQALNVRAAPGANASLVTTIQEGTEVELYEQRVESGTPWQRIRAGSVEGWASASYLQEITP